MIALGGITRLTDSGLSIVHWKPISGVIPPLNSQDWQAEFEHYKKSPEFHAYNSSMNLEGFKKIFFWEYTHRLLGRFLGVLFLIPFCYFWLTGQLTCRLKKRLFIIFLLGGIQGFLGWYMVMSGLVNRPDVSHFRLAVHLVMALIIMSTTLFVLLSETTQTLAKGFKSRKAFRAGLATLGLLGFQVVYGAFTAGLKAGYSYTTWPKMGGDWIPQSIWMMGSFFNNILENPFMIQFIHRHFAWIVVISFFIFFKQLPRKQLSLFQRVLRMALMAGLTAQVGLGILVLLTRVHLHVALTHQLIAVCLVLGTVSLVISVKEENHEENDTDRSPVHDNAT